MNRENELWREFSENYDDRIFSLTRIPQRRKQILDKIKLGLILNLGCGSTPYLNISLVNQGNHVIATDFCRAMLDSAQKRFIHPNLEYQLADSRDLPFKNSEFDSVISVNSILPPERKSINQIVDETYRVLNKNGIFVAFLCSYDSVKKSIKNLGSNIEIDDNQLRVKDTTGWQCFHNPESIKQLMKKSAFSRYTLDKVFLKTKQEINEFKRLYGVDTSKSLIFEYLLVAHK